MKQTISVLISLLLLSSCSHSLDHRVEGKNFTVHFTTKEDLTLAQKVAFFWKEGAYAGSKHQHIKVKSEQGKVYLYLIKSQQESTEIPYEHQAILLQLQQDLDQYLQQKNETRILICNAKFEVISKLNQE